VGAPIGRGCADVAPVARLAIGSAERIGERVGLTDQTRQNVAAEIVPGDARTSILSQNARQEIRLKDVDPHRRLYPAIRVRRYFLQLLWFFDEGTYTVAVVDGHDSEVVRFPSFDGMVIPNVLYKPQGASAQHPVPALVWVHGGPGGQSRRGYSALQQFLVNHGYAVLAINNRGSSGYGKQFFAADDQKHGREPLWDTVAAKKYLQSQPWVDKEKIGILGGSYGGYMVLAALAFQPDAFKAGVDLFGISNWVRTLNSIPPYWESFRKALYQEVGDPGKQEQMLRDTSPLFHADKIRKPLMVLQGKNDPRVIKPESDEIVEAVKKNGVPVEYVVFDDEGHGFAKKKNEIEAYENILKFLDQYLKGVPPAAAAAH